MHRNPVDREVLGKIDVTNRPTEGVFFTGDSRTLNKDLINFKKPWQRHKYDSTVTGALELSMSTLTVESVRGTEHFVWDNIAPVVATVISKEMGLEAKDLEPQDKRKLSETILDFVQRRYPYFGKYWAEINYLNDSNRNPNATQQDKLEALLAMDPEQLRESFESTRGVLLPLLTEEPIPTTNFTTHTGVSGFNFMGPLDESYDKSPVEFFDELKAFTFNASNGAKNKYEEFFRKFVGRVAYRQSKEIHKDELKSINAALSKMEKIIDRYHLKYYGENYLPKRKKHRNTKDRFLQVQSQFEKLLLNQRASGEGLLQNEMTLAQKELINYLGSKNLEGNVISRFYSSKKEKISYFLSSLETKVAREKKELNQTRDKIINDFIANPRSLNSEELCEQLGIRDQQKFLQEYKAFYENYSHTLPLRLCPPEKLCEDLSSLFLVNNLTKNEEGKDSLVGYLKNELLRRHLSYASKRVRSDVDGGLSKKAYSIVAPWYKIIEHLLRDDFKKIDNITLQEINNNLTKLFGVLKNSGASNDAIKELVKDLLYVPDVDRPRLALPNKYEIHTLQVTSEIGLYDASLFNTPRVPLLIKYQSETMLQPKYYFIGIDKKTGEKKQTELKSPLPGSDKINFGRQVQRLNDVPNALYEEIQIRGAHNEEHYIFHNFDDVLDKAMNLSDQHTGQVQQANRELLSKMLRKHVTREMKESIKRYYTYEAYQLDGTKWDQSPILFRGMAVSSQYIVEINCFEGEYTPDLYLLGWQEVNFKEHILLSGGGSTEMAGGGPWNTKATTDNHKVAYSFSSAGYHVTGDSGLYACQRLLSIVRGVPGVHSMSKLYNQTSGGKDNDLGEIMPSELRAEDKILDITFSHGTWQITNVFLGNLSDPIEGVDQDAFEILNLAVTAYNATIQRSCSFAQTGICLPSIDERNNQTDAYRKMHFTKTSRTERRFDELGFMETHQGDTRYVPSVVASTREFSRVIIRKDDLSRTLEIHAFSYHLGNVQRQLSDIASLDAGGAHGRATVPSLQNEAFIQVNEISVQLGPQRSLSIKSASYLRFQQLGVMRNYQKEEEQDDALVVSTI